MAFSMGTPRINRGLRPSTNLDDSGSRRTSDFGPAGSSGSGQRQHRQEDYRRPVHRAVAGTHANVNGPEIVVSFHPSVPLGEDFVVEIGGTVKKYLGTRNIQEAITSLKALPSKHHYLFINGLTDTALECGPWISSLARKLLRAINKHAVVSPEDLGRGLLLTNDRAVCISDCDDATYESLIQLINSAGLDAEELINGPGLHEHEVHEQSPSDREPNSDTGEPTLAQPINEASCSTNPDPDGAAPVSQRRFRITTETQPDDIIRYFERVTNVNNYTTTLDHNQQRVFGGHGGSANVYRVATTDNKHVAVNTVEISAAYVSKQRTARELEVWATLRHENILPLLGLAQYDGCVAMVSNWMGLGSVVSFVNANPNEDRYSLSRQIVQAVVYLHSREIVHGDIKGENVLMSDDGKPMLTDFGLTVMMESNLMFSATTGGGGTLRWMAPELFVPEGRRSKEADVYALGMTVLQTLTGELPFAEIAYSFSVPDAVRYQRQIPQRPESIKSPSPLADVFWETMTKCWMYEPAHRASASEVEELLAGGLTPEEEDGWTTIDVD